MPGNALKIGALVYYYKEGTRVGHVEEIEEKRVRIRPIAKYKAGPPRCVWIPIENVTIIEENK